MAKKKRSGMRYQLKTKQVKVNRVRANRKYKDTVFRMLFSDKKHLLSLYNAVSGKTYTDPEQLQIVTLENAVYMGMKNDLELKVLTLNINKGHNLDLMKQCRILEEYAQYVDRVRRYVRKMNLDAAVHRAVDECIREGILEDFLRANRAEVEKVSIFEYDKKEEERKLREAEYEAGKEDGAMALITVAKRFHLNNNEIMKALCEDLGLDEKTAGGLLKKYETFEDISHQDRAEVEKVSIFEYDKEEEERKLREAEHEAGREEGRKEGEQAMAELMNKLMASDRMEDMKRALEDDGYLAQLMMELGIKVNG